MRDAASFLAFILIAFVVLAVAFVMAYGLLWWIS